MEQKYSSVEIPQSRKLTEKGLQYQIDMKVNSLKSKKTALTKTLRKTLLLRGKCSKVYERKQELSKAQVLGSEFEDLYHEIKEVAQGQEIVSHSDDKKVCLSTPKVVTVLKLLHQQLAILYKLLIRSAHHLSHQWQLLHLHCLIKVFIPKVKQLLPVVDWREWHLR